MYICVCVVCIYIIYIYIYPLILHHIPRLASISLKEKVSETTEEGKTSKLSWRCEMVKVDKCYKVTSDWAQTWLAANNQIQVCVL